MLNTMNNDLADVLSVSQVHQVAPDDEGLTFKTSACSFFTVFNKTTSTFKFLTGISIPLHSESMISSTVLQIPCVHDNHLQNMNH